MNIKSIISGIAVIVLTGTLAACKKSFVDLTPRGVIPVSTSYSNEADFQSALTGVYSSMRVIYNSQWAFTELPSDNTVTFSESEAAWGEEDKLTWAATSTNLETVWTQHYKTIALCNIILGRIGAIAMPQADKNNIIGQAQFIRALMYFNMVRMFGGVPLVLKEITTEAQAYTYNRTPATDVYTQIETDLTAAAAVLPATNTGANIGRATSTAASGLLGKVYMFEKKFTLAESTLAQVAALAPSPLTPYNQIFGVVNNNNPEIIFSIQYLSGGYGEGNTFAQYFLPQPGTSIVGINGASYNIGTSDLYNAFEPGDLRTPLSIGVFNYGTLVYYYATKFVYNSGNTSGEGGNDWPVLRFGDIILLYAEALNENGKTEQALTELNLIRARAGLAPKTGLTQIDTRTSIYNERRIELCFEGERWFDLIRWNLFIPVMQAYKTKYNLTAIAPPIQTMALFPIPFIERSVNPKLTQNPGY